ncbi:pectate lyase [Opitutus sp. ER46]|nr:pectate lyase [Opitutus sp. ER46]
MTLAGAQASQVRTPFVRAGASGLSYTADARGNRVPDLSGAGYAGGGVPLPLVPARVRVTPADGDDGARIQAALDFVATLPADAEGRRGAVVLARGRYEIAQHLRVPASGVVLRGEGAGEDGTVLVATGTDRRTLIQVHGAEDARRDGPARRVTDVYVPVGAVTLTVDNVDGLRVGDRVLVERPCTAEWIAAVGMDDAPGREPFSWKKGMVPLRWERTLVAIDGARLKLDAPLTTALDPTFGGGTVTRFRWPGRLREVGVENLRLESAYDAANPKDEAHAWMAVALDAVENAWVSNVTAVHFASSVVQLGAGVRAVTVQDCASLAPVSELGGYRRHSFHTSGQQTLFLRCRAVDGLRDFTAGYGASGPNVFLECRADSARGPSGSIGSWASGLLFDNVHIDGAGLQLDNLETWNQGVGWSAANSVLWQSSAAEITVRRPPTADNWAIGVWGEFRGDGWWDQVNEFIQPQSLYRAQLAARAGERVLAVLEPRTFLAIGADVPSLESALPDLARRLAPRPPPPGHPLALQRGWLVSGDALLIGRQLGEMQWWRGSLAPTRAAEYGPNLTRFVPGQTGLGWTDDLTALADGMVAANQVAVRHHYGLWYDRRRMDHQRVRRATPDVWPPFFEQPFARSGQGEAWDRLSKYDLTKYNPWYFGRLHEFAELSRQRGLVLINEMYFQHNILEAGAHWADFPWRPANCLQETGFPEPPPYTDNEGEFQGPPEQGKRIFMAAQFYDVNHPVRRGLHRAFIRQCLANLADQPNVIHTLTAENSGPLPFLQFWLDVVAEWEAETGRHPLIALSAPKDVQDAILADAKRAAVVDVIDLSYWWRLDDGRLYAPAGGTQLAPRQHERLWREGRPSATALAAMVAEYRGRFPGKAVISSLEQGDGWCFAAAGGSLARLPAATDARLKAAIVRMQPVAGVEQSKRTWALGEAGGAQYFVCRADSGPAVLVLPNAAGRYRIQLVDAGSGQLQPGGFVTLEPGRKLTLARGEGPRGLWWLERVTE